MSTSEAPTFAELFTEHAAYVGRLLRYMGVPERDLDDACQDTFLVVHKKLETLRPDVSPRAWIYGICLHLAREARRRMAKERARTERLDSERQIPALGSPVDEVHAARQQALAFLDLLDEDKREVFLLHDVEELTMREICDALGIPLQTGYSRLRLARERLQQKMGARRPKGAA